MTFPKSILLLIGLSMLAALVACGSSSHHTITPPPVITVSVGAVPSTLAVNGSTQITATTNDTAGVNWSCTPAGSCGTFNPTTTLTGVATTYTAPAAPTAGVVITATSVTTSSITASTPTITIVSGATTLADGNYVFSLAGEDANNSNYFVAGEITILGGVITAGEQDLVDSVHDQTDSINPASSAITTTADGNLQITLVTCNGTNCGATDTTVGVSGTETLNGTLLPLSTTGRTFITEFDASASASGELDPQDLAGAGSTPPANGYAFVLNGYDHVIAPLAIGGIINIDDIGGVVGSISGTGSIFDANDAGTTSPSQPFAPSTVSAPDPLGRVTFTLNTSLFTQILLHGYIVDSSRIQLVEITDTYGGTLGGVAYSQGVANTGNFTAASAVGTYVVGVTGFDGNGVLQAVNQLTLVAGAGVTGFLDYNDLATSSLVTAGASPDPVTAAGYTVDTAGIGGASAGDITIAGVTDSGATVTTNVQLYLDGNGHALAITMDPGDAVAGVGFMQGAGIASTSFNGPYALDVSGDDVTLNEFELDGVGPVSATAGTIAGTVDLNWLASAGPTYPAKAVNGTFVTTGAGASNGIFTGTVTGVDVQSCIIVGTCNVDSFSYYLIDAAGDNIAIETDENQLTLGFFLQQ